MSKTEQTSDNPQTGNSSLGVVRLSLPTVAESEEQIQEWARKMKLDFTKPQDFVLGWRKCFEWIKNKIK